MPFASPALFPPDDIDCVEYMVPVPVVERAVHCSDMPCNQVFLNVKISVGVLWISWYSVPPNTHSEGTDYVRSNNLHVRYIFFLGSNHLLGTA